MVVMKRATLKLRACLLGAAIAGVLLVGAAPAGAAAYFHSPSGNIGCGLAGSGARCDIRSHTWHATRKPRNCRTDWGFGLTVGRHGKGGFFCAGDTVLGLGRSLPYGRSLTRGLFTCTSRTDGVRCINRRTRHGFKLSRARAIRF